MSDALKKVAAIILIGFLWPGAAAATGKVIIIGEKVTGNVIPWRGMGAQSMRFQCLWLQSDINFAGYINKVEFLRHSGSTTGAFNNCRVWFCHTTKGSLEATFDNNYAGKTPVQVMDELSYILSGTDWLAVDITPDKFFYNNVDNLLMEIRWNGDSGDDFYCYRYNTNAGRVYAQNHNAASGTVLDQGQYIRLHIGTTPGVEPTSLGRVKTLFR